MREELGDDLPVGGLGRFEELLELVDAAGDLAEVLHNGVSVVGRLVI